MAFQRPSFPSPRQRLTYCVIAISVQNLAFLGVKIVSGTFALSLTDIKYHKAPCGRRPLIQVLVRPTIFLRNLRVAYGRLGAPADHVADGWFGRNVFTLNQGWPPIGLRYLLFWNMEGQRR